MLKIRHTVLAAVIGVLASVPIPAQDGLKNKDAVAVGPNDRVLNTPYSAKRHFTAVRKLADGTVNREDSGGSEARDSEGRTYSSGERYWTYFDGKANVLGSEMLYRIDDPVAQTETRWDTTSNIVKTIRWSKSDPGSATGCSSACDDAEWNLFDHIEKLGKKTIGGFVIEGTRSSYTVPAGEEHNNQRIVVVLERWYCPEFEIVILETNDNPRRGTTKSELTDIVRGKPDVAQYRPPADHIIRELQIP